VFGLGGMPSGGNFSCEEKENGRDDAYVPPTWRAIVFIGRGSCFEAVGTDTTAARMGLEAVWPIARGCVHKDESSGGLFFEPVVDNGVFSLDCPPITSEKLTLLYSFGLGFSTTV
jgi:hypothetical protein